MRFSSTLRRLAFLLCAVFTLASLTSCLPEAEGDISFTDSLGNSVVLDGAPGRVAVLFSSLAEIWSSAGGEVAVSVGESVLRGFCDADTPSVHSDSGGVGKSINIELLLAQAPDFVICTADYPGQLELAPILRAAGIPVAYFRVKCFRDYLGVLGTMCDITGDAAAYDTYGRAVGENISALLSGIDAECSGKKILFARATKTTLKAKLPTDHFAAEMLSELGCCNIAEGAPTLLDGLDLEYIISENPEYIFISLMGDEDGAKGYVEQLFSGGGWAELDAVKNKKYIFLSKELFQYKPCARWYEAYRVLYGYLYE